MKNSIKISLLLPVMAVAAGCSSDKDPDYDLEGDYTVVMSMQTSETRATAEELYKVIDENRIFFATYNIDMSGSAKDWLYDGSSDASSKANSALEATYFTPSWGPSVSARLEKKSYSGGFYTGIFSVPQYANSGFTVKDKKNLGNASFQTITFPNPANGKEVWEPSSDKDIPMAGITKISSGFLAPYNASVHNHSPLKLPVTNMVRSMAKIVIVDEADIISTASLESLKTGFLTPNPTAWMKGDAVLPPYSPSATAANLFTQKLTKSNGVVDGKPAYIFYTFERDFSNIKANADARKIITLTANGNYNLTADKKTVKVSFSPYNIGSQALDNPESIPAGDWAGIKRNTVYYFHIYAPQTGGIQIQVSASDWVHHDAEDFTF